MTVDPGLIDYVRRADPSLRETITRVVNNPDSFNVWLKCDGRLVDPDQYPALCHILGTNRLPHFSSDIYYVKAKASKTMNTTHTPVGTITEILGMKGDALWL